MKPDNLETILSLLKELDSDNSFEIFIPSLNEEVTFKQLTTEQLKRLLKTLLDSPINYQEFSLDFNSIIKENCLTPNIDTDKLTILDKHIILFKTRIESVSSEYTFNITENINSTVSLNTNLQNILDKEIILLPETFTVNNCSLTCSLPTLYIENKFERDFRQSIKQNINSSDDLRNIIGDTFINEITKFVNSVKINETEINLLTYDFKDRVKIIEELPASLINNVIKYIEKYRNIVKELFTFNIQIEDTIIQQEIPQDASFFNLQ